MRGIGKDARKFVKRLEAAGCEVVHGSKHLAVLRDGKRVATMSVSASDHRALLNLRSVLRRQGVEI